MAIVANSILMAFVLYLFHVVKVRKGNKFGSVALVAFWMAFEYIHLRWDITWPWLSLGNVFANQTEIIQWYEYTGVFGGTLWVLGANMLLFELMKKRAENLPLKRSLIACVLVLLVPVLFSLIRYATYTEASDPLNVVAVQPNIDPYNEKFNGTGEEQLAKLLRLTATMVDSSTD